MPLTANQKQVIQHAIRSRRESEKLNWSEFKKTKMDYYRTRALTLRAEIKGMREAYRLIANS